MRLVPQAQAQARGRRGRRARGSVALLAAVLIFVLIAFAALAIDIAWVRLARAQLQDATDAAAHAAMATLRGTGSVGRARATAIQVARRNRVAGQPLTIGGDDVVFGRWDYRNQAFSPGGAIPNAVMVQGRRTITASDGPIALFLGPALGVPHAIAARSATAALPTRVIAVAQDISSSFVDAIDAAAAADVALLGAIRDQSLPGDQIGMAMFTGDASEFSSMAYVDADYATILQRWQGDGRTVYDDAKKSGITVCNFLDRYPTIQAPWNHAWVPACVLGNDGTNQGAALGKAAGMLDRAAGPQDLKVIILVTDGEPQCCYPPWGGCPRRDACAQARAAYGVAMADEVAARGVHVFTVSLGADAYQHAYNASLVRGIGRAYNTPDKDQLRAILLDIAQALPISLVQ